MSADTLKVEGELFLRLEVVAQCFEVKTVWLREVYDCGLLGAGVRRDRELHIAAVHLDRVATIVRMQLVFGMDLVTIEHALGQVD
jgi:hypothetical protein